MCVCVCAQSLSPVQLLFATLWIDPSVACQTPLYMKFSRHEYWSGLPLHPPRDLPNQRIEATSLTSPALEDGFFTTSTAWEAQGVGTAVLKSHTSGQWITYKLENNYITDIIPQESSEPHARLPSLGVRHQEEEPPEHLIWRPVGCDYSNSTGLEGKETPLLEGTQNISCAPHPREKEVTQ